MTMVVVVVMVMMVMVIMCMMVMVVMVMVMMCMMLTVLSLGGSVGTIYCVMVQPVILVDLFCSDEYKKFSQDGLKNGMKRLVLQTLGLKRNWRDLKKYKRYELASDISFY
jgi:hypothetical protein